MASGNLNENDVKSAHNPRRPGTFSGDYKINRLRLYTPARGRGEFIDISEGDKVLIVEDIITTGGSVFELIEVVESYNANIVGIVSLIHRSITDINFGYIYHTLLKFPVDSWEDNMVPKWLNKIEITKPGRTGKK